jgi:hypothetical protein
MEIQASDIASLIMLIGLPLQITDNHHHTENRSQKHQQCENNDTVFLGMRVLIHEGPAGESKQDNITNACYDL